MTESKVIHKFYILTSLQLRYWIMLSWIKWSASLSLPNGSPLTVSQKETETKNKTHETQTWNKMKNFIGKRLNICTNMFNFNRDKNIWLLPFDSLDKNLHWLFCESSTCSAAASQSAQSGNHITWRQKELLVVFSYFLGVLQHRLIAQGPGCPGSWNPLKSNLEEFK